MERKVLQKRKSQYLPMSKINIYGKNDDYAKWVVKRVGTAP